MDYEVEKATGGNLADCWNLLVSSNPDKTNGPIVFLRTSAKLSEKPLQKDIEIRPGQQLFVPAVTSVINKVDIPSCGDDASKQRAAAEKDIDDGDNPPGPDSITIDGTPVVGDLKEYRVVSPQFKLKVDRRCELEEVTYEPGESLPSVAAGYCLLIKFPRRDKPYMIHVKTKGSQGYSTEAKYSIRVV